ncbi:glycosyltransferase [Desemzia sp. FAM 23989]|uniref:glycosyltransferase n=1 Tax=Desemzia sp. FAM 23989 TaxID=3259523 RepID=UPI003883E2D2
MNDIVFSIIVPVYNVEVYLEKCIESLINQTFRNIEILLIDDGSTDNSLKLCNEYSEKYNNIKVYHKSNGGLSDARNYGLIKASGNYVMFVDSDDYISLDACQRFYDVLMNEEFDIVTGNCLRIEPDREIKQIFNQSVKNCEGKFFLEKQLETRTFYAAACRNIYKKDFLLKNNLSFKKGIYHEDEQWTPRVFLTAKKVMNTSIVFYHHIIREGSITQKKSQEKNGRDLISIYNDLAPIFFKLDDPYLKKLLNGNLVEIYLEGIYKTKGATIIHKKDMTFLRKNAISKGNKFKVRLIMLNTKIYYFYSVCRRNYFNKNSFKKKFISTKS